MLYHEQAKVWQPGLVHSVQDNHVGVTWKSAAGWKDGWNDATTRAPSATTALSVRSVEPAAEGVAAAAGIVHLLRWDDVCDEMLPQHFWPARLKLFDPHFLAPTTTADGLARREEQTQRAASAAGNLATVKVPPGARADTAGFLGSLAAQSRIGPNRGAAAAAAATAGGGGRERETGNALDRIMESEEFSTTFGDLIAGHEGEATSPSIAFAVMAGRMAAADMGETAALRAAGLDPNPPPGRAPLDVVRPHSGADALAQLRGCPPFIKAFLWTVMSNVYRAPDTRGKRNNALLSVPTDRAAAESRALGVEAICAILFNSHGAYSNLTSLTGWHRRFAVTLLMANVPEKTMRTITGEVKAVASPKSGRRDILAASKALTARRVLCDGLPPPYKPAVDEVPVMLETADNVNKGAQAKVALGTSYLGFSLSAAEAARLAELMDDLPLPNANTVRMQSLTPDDKAVLGEVVLLQNMQALSFVAVERAATRTRPPAAAAAAPSAVLRAPPAPALGDTVTFHALGVKHNAKVTAVDGDKVTAEYAFGDGVVKHTTKPATAFKVATLPPPPPPTAAAPASDKKKRKREETFTANDADMLAMDIDGDGRKRVCPNPTFCHSLLHYTDSSHHTTSGVVLEAWHEAQTMPITIGAADHEFHPSMAMATMLHPQRTMVFQAYGHLGKAVSTGLCAFHEAGFTRRLAEGGGVRHGSTAWKVLVGGSNLRRTQNFVLREDYVLRAALAAHFFDAHPEHEQYFAQGGRGGGADDAITRTGRVVDDAGRTLPFSYSAGMAASARAFKDWLRALVGGPAVRPPVKVDSLVAWKAAASEYPAGTAPAVAEAIDSRLHDMPNRNLAGNRKPTVGAVFAAGVCSLQLQ